MTFFVAALGREIIFWSSMADIQTGQSGKPVYLAADLSFPASTGVSLIDTRLDCRGHSINAKEVAFDALQNCELHNCAISTGDGLALHVNNLLMINCSLVVTKQLSAIDDATNVTFVGVRFNLKDYLILKGQNIELVGCVVKMVANVKDRRIAVFDYITSMQIQNSFFEVEIMANNSEDSAGIINQANNLTILNSRATIKMDAYCLQKNSLVAGIIVKSNKLLTIQYFDAIVVMKLRHGYRIISGFLGKIYEGKDSIKDVSLYSDITIDLQLVEGLSNVGLELGVILTDNTFSEIVMQRFSSFMDVTYNVSGSCSSMTISGVFAQSSGANIQATHIYTIGDIYIKGPESDSLYVSGLSTFMGSGTVFKNCAYIGDIKVENSIISFQYVTSLICKPIEGNMIDSQTVSTIECDLSTSKRLFAAAVASGTGGNYTNLAINMTILVHVQFEQSTLQLSCGGSGFGASAALRNSVVTCDIRVDKNNSGLMDGYIGIIAARTNGIVQNCSGNGTISIISATSTTQNCYVGAVAGSSVGLLAMSDISVFAIVDIPNTHITVGSAFGDITDIPLSNIFVAAKIIGRSNVLLSGSGDETVTTSTIYLDCSLEGNDDTQDNCVNDLNWSETAANLGSSFSYNESLNNGYPHLVDLPAFQGNEFTLPQSGPFSEEFYYLDANGMPFSKTDYQICKGACYGVYSSPAVRECEEEGVLYCIDVEKAKVDFPAQSCMLENAECNNGVSVCKNDAELVLEGAEYSCVETCPNCSNGRCLNATCECNPYYSGEACSKYSCDADSPTCFGDQTQQCKPDNSGCQAVDWCAALNCVHGKCADSQQNRCACDNLWTGVSCDTCYSFGPDCSIRQAECDALCGGHGVCRTPLTTICTCEDGLGGFNCQQCAEGHVFQDNQCICQLEGKPCPRGHVCVDGKCVQACLVTDKNCISCHQIDPSLCSGCARSYRLVNGLCEFHQSKAIAPAIGALFGIVAVIAICLGVYLLLRMKWVQKTPASALSGVKPDITGGKQTGKEQQLIKDAQVVIPIENPE